MKISYDYYCKNISKTKPSSVDPEFRHCFGAETSLPLSQCAPALPHVTSRLIHITG